MPKVHLPRVLNYHTPTPRPPQPLTQLRNGGFETRPDDAWSETPRTLIFWDDQYALPMPDGHGHGFGWIGGIDGETSILAQPVTLPAGHSGLRLRLSYWLSSQEGCDTADLAQVIVDTRVVKPFVLCNENNTYDAAIGHGWVSESVDFVLPAGGRVNLAFRAVLDADQRSNFFIDNVSLCSTDPRARPQDRCP